MVNYTCEPCGFSTTIKTHYTRHLTTKKHERNSKPFTCEHCDETFTLKSSLDRHIEKFCNPTLKLKTQLAERDKTIEELKQSTTVNNYNTNIQCNIYNMPPIKFLNTFFSNNPSFQQILDCLTQNNLSNEELASLENAHSTGNPNFIGYEIDKILKSRNHSLIQNLDNPGKTCPNFMFSNDGSFRRYIAKGPNEWEFFTDSENLENSTSIILDQATLANNNLVNLNSKKRDRAIIAKCIQRINDWNTSKLQLLDKI